MDEAYKSVQTLHGTRYPAAVVLIEIDPSQVDVNVSPTKTEVRFTREGDIYAAVYKAVQEALMAGGLVPTIIQKTNTPEDASPPPPAMLGEREATSAVCCPCRRARRRHTRPGHGGLPPGVSGAGAADVLPVSDDPFDDAGSFAAAAPPPVAASARLRSAPAPRDGRVRAAGRHRRGLPGHKT